jgi:voltage-gated potassium channel
MGPAGQWGRGTGTRPPPLVIRRSLLLAALLPVAILGIGTAGYVVIEGWSVLDALWMVAITLTTIGYGEVQPLSAEGRIFTMAYLAGGLSVGTYAVTRLTSALLEGDIVQLYRENRRRRRMKALVDHYIVIGYGRLGEVVVRELQETGAQVCIVESDPDIVQRLERDGAIAILQGDGAEDSVLRQAGIERARGLAVTAAPVAQAIFVTLSARQLNPAIPILTRVDSDESSVKARRAGATAVVSPHIMGGWRMAHGLARPHTTNFLDLATLAEHDDIMLDEVEVDVESKWVERTLGEMQVAREQGVLVVAIRRASGEMVVTPTAATPLHACDILIVVGEPARVKKFNEVIRRG